MSRAFLVGLLLSLGVVLAALVASAAYQAATNGVVPVPVISLAAATMACLVVLAGIYLTQPGGHSGVPYCHNCGTRMFATLRSMDRREVFTCFACGSEWAVPAAPAGLVGPRPPRSSF